MSTSLPKSCSPVRATAGAQSAEHVSRMALRSVPSVYEECVPAGKHKILKSINVGIDHVREKL